MNEYPASVGGAHAQKPERATGALAHRQTVISSHSRCGLTFAHIGSEQLLVTINKALSIYIIHGWEQGGRWQKYCKVPSIQSFAWSLEYDGLLYPNVFRLVPVVACGYADLSANPNGHTLAESWSDRTPLFRLGCCALCAVEISIMVLTERTQRSAVLDYCVPRRPVASLRVTQCRAVSVT